MKNTENKYRIVENWVQYGDKLTANYTVSTLNSPNLMGMIFLFRFKPYWSRMQKRIDGMDGSIYIDWAFQSVESAQRQIDYWCKVDAVVIPQSKVISETCC